MSNVWDKLNLKNTTVFGSLFNFSFNQNIFDDYNQKEKIELLKIISKTISIYVLALCQLKKSNETNLFLNTGPLVCKTSINGLIYYYFCDLFCQKFNKKIYTKNKYIYEFVDKKDIEKYIECDDKKVVEYLSNLNCVDKKDIEKYRVKKDDEKDNKKDNKKDVEYLSNLSTFDCVNKNENITFPLIAETKCQYVTTGASINTEIYAIDPDDYEPDEFTNINTDGIKIGDNYQIVDDKEINEIGSYTDHDYPCHEKSELFCHNSMYKSYGNLDWYTKHIDKLKQKTIETKNLKKYITFDFNIFKINVELFDNENYKNNSKINCLFNTIDPFYFAGTPCYMTQIEMIKYLDSEQIVSILGVNKISLEFDYNLNMDKSVNVIATHYLLEIL